MNAKANRMSSTYRVGAIPTNNKSSKPSRVPLVVSSSASSSEDEASAPGLGMENTHMSQAGLISPQTICSQRALSIPVTSAAAPVVFDDQCANSPEEEEDDTSEASPHCSVSLNHRPAQVNDCTFFKTTPAPMRYDAWAEPSASAFKVRGRDYCKSNSKKITSAVSVFELLTVDMVLAPRTMYSGLCSHPNERIQLALAKEAESGVRQLPEFIFAVNLCIPAAGHTGRKGATVVGPEACYHCVSYFGIDDRSVLTDTSTPEGKLMNQFFFGNSDEFRDNAFKLIPRIVDGNFVVRKAVGSKPSLLGTKVKQHYVRTERFCEVLVDIASSSVAQTIVQLALGYAKNLTVDMMFLFEGNDETTLPERILGGLRVCNVDFKYKDGQRIVEE